MDFYLHAASKGRMQINPTPVMCICHSKPEGFGRPSFTFHKHGASRSDQFLSRKPPSLITATSSRNLFEIASTTCSTTATSYSSRCIRGIKPRGPRTGQAAVQKLQQCSNPPKFLGCRKATPDHYVKTPAVASAEGANDTKPRKLISRTTEVSV